MIQAADDQAVQSSVVWGEGPVADALVTRGIPRSTPDAPSDGQAIVYATLPPVESGEGMTAWRRQSWSGRVVGEIGLASASFGLVAGADAVGARFVTPYPFPQDLDGTGPWIDAYLGMGPYVSPPGPYALPTYEAVYVIADAIAAALDGGRTPDRAALVEALPDTHRSGRLGTIAWDDQGYWRGAPLYLYRWTDAGPEFVERLP